MATSLAEVRAAALALPQAHEAAHFHMASFRVGKKIFCTIHAEERRVMVKLDPEDQRNLIDGDVIRPVPGYWGQKGATLVDYERIEPGRMGDLLRMAWAQVAPRRLLL